jgi:hypothetical protein
MMSALAAQLIKAGWATPKPDRAPRPDVASLTTEGMRAEAALLRRDIADIDLQLRDNQCRGETRGPAWRTKATKAREAHARRHQQIVVELAARGLAWRDRPGVSTSKNGDGAVDRLGPLPNKLCHFGPLVKDETTDWRRRGENCLRCRATAKSAVGHPTCRAVRGSNSAHRSRFRSGARNQRSHHSTVPI